MFRTRNNIKLIKPIILVLLTFFIVSSSTITEKILTKEQAITLAEEFIKVNGYTTLPADKSKLSFELLDQLGNTNVDSILKYRYNTLHSKAFYIGENAERWDVGFLSTNVDLNKLDTLKLKTNLPGRAVVIEKNGKEIRMAHKEPLFSTWNIIDK